MAFWKKHTNVGESESQTVLFSKECIKKEQPEVDYMSSIERDTNRYMSEDQPNELVPFYNDGSFFNQDKPEITTLFVKQEDCLEQKPYADKKMYTPEEAMELLLSGEIFDEDDEFPVIDEAFADSSDSDENQQVSDTDVDEQPKNAAPATTAPEEHQWINFASDLRDIPFTGTAIPINISDINNPAEYFNLLATNQFYNLLITKTNAYAEDIFLKGVEEHSRITRWKDVDADEFKVFLGLLYHTGTIRMPRIEDYWKTNFLFNIPVFSQYMPRNRFQSLLRCLHFADNPTEGEPMPTDHLYKIRPLFEYFNNRMEEIHYPAKHLSISESLVLWRGRLVFQQNKKYKYGLKLHILCEPNGMVQKILPYTGANDTGTGGLGHAANVVYKLLEHKLNKGHAIYMDHFYNSIHLANNLLAKDTYVTGTLRKNRKGIPKDLLDQKIKNGELVTKYANNISIQKWKHKREILMISTEHKGELLQTVNKRGQEVTRPKSILEYNKYMRGVDMIDQMLSYYPCERKTLRWNQKIGLHIFQLILLNSYFLHNKHATNKLSLYDYRLEIIRYLLSHKRDLKKAPKKSKPNHTIHAPQSMKSDGKRKSAQKRCKLCYMNGKRKDTTYHCPQCDGQPPLCLECFPIYHKNKQ